MQGFRDRKEMEARIKFSPADFKAMVYHFYSTGIRQERCYEEFFRFFGNFGPGRTTIHKWYAEFASSHRVKDSFPEIAFEEVTSEIFNTIRIMVKNDAHVPRSEIESTLRVGSTAVDLVLCRLNLTYQSSCWLSATLTNGEKQARVQWCKMMLNELGDKDSMKLLLTSHEALLYNSKHWSRERSWGFRNVSMDTSVKQIKKKLFATAIFQRNGHVASMLLAEQHTSIANQYAVRCISQNSYDTFFTAPKSKTLRQLFYHYSRVRGGSNTLQLFVNGKIVSFQNPPHSPDLLPNYFAFFPKINANLRGYSFNSIEAALAAYNKEAAAISKLDCNRIFDEWVERLERCIASQGNYFEVEHRD